MTVSKRAQIFSALALLRGYYREDLAAEFYTKGQFFSALIRFLIGVLYSKKIVVTSFMEFVCR
ncbi:MAG: hypothetical protein CMP89_14885 [Gammaproteobacteria bacterium]|nr:hypothetical protein [Gammaproteobacteria bacterium]